jgi:hypothetical protein
MDESFLICWKGNIVIMTDYAPGQLANCQKYGHDIGVMHHNAPIDERNLNAGFVHYCPTELLMCYRCFAVGDEPEPFECNRWGV